MPSRATGRRLAGLVVALALVASVALAFVRQRAERARADNPGSGRQVVFVGMCDASAAVPLSDRLFLVANDEDNVLRAYDARVGGAPVWQYDVSAALALPAKKKGPPETDLEAATRIGEHAYFLTSHGRNRAGKRKPERLRFFATTTSVDGRDLRVVGTPYERLLEDLLNEPRLRRFELATAAERAPSDEGGLNIEGMTARVEGGVWVGFRSPIPQGNALLVPLLNPERVVQGAPAELGEPSLLPLNGLGIRGMATWRGRYLVLAGPAAGGGVSQLFSWDGKRGVHRVESVDLRGFNPEGIFALEAATDALVISDDGSDRIAGKECKRLADPAKQRFRGTWIRLEP